MATLNILYEDPHILVCVKPHGIATQSKSIRYPDTWKVCSLTAAT